MAEPGIFVFVDRTRQSLINFHRIVAKSKSDFVFRLSLLQTGFNKSCKTFLVPVEVMTPLWKANEGDPHAHYRPAYNKKSSGSFQRLRRLLTPEGF